MTNKAAPWRMTREQREAWSNLCKAYDCGSNDRHVSLAEFRALWNIARASTRKTKTAWLCPVHESLDKSGKLEPLDNCVACLRAERNELREQLREARAALDAMTKERDRAAEAAIDLSKQLSAMQLERYRLRDALQNLAFYTARISPPPYGHSCRWCEVCVQRAKDDARAALAGEPAKEPQNT